MLLRNDLGLGFTDVTAGPLGDASWTNGAAWADVDLDGDLDLYLANQGAANKLLRNDDGTFVDATPALLADPGSGQGVAWADVNGDGTPDLYLANADGANRHFQNYSGGGNGWLHVDLTGTLSNTDAVGAKVRIVVDGLSQRREVSAGTGWLSQDSRRVMFGLGAAGTVDTVEVRWPSGVVQRVTGVAAGQILEIVEDDPTGSPAIAILPSSFRLSTAVPNPFRRVTEIQLDLPASSAVRLRVYDVSGRLVRTLIEQPLGPGRYRVTWDGRDSGGRSVASGMYFYHAEASGLSSTRRVVRLK